MYNRFTNNAKRVLQYAQQTAQRLGHDYVGTEHILLGLVLNWGLRRKIYCGPSKN